MRTLQILIRFVILFLVGCSSGPAPSPSSTKTTVNSNGIILPDAVYRTGTAYRLQGYVAGDGDTLASIAQKNHTTVANLKATNPGIDSKPIQPGQKIVIAQPEIGAVYDLEVYTVSAGDSLNSIAQKFNTTATNILALNPWIVNPHQLWIGQTLIVASKVKYNPALPNQERDLDRFRGSLDLVPDEKGNTTLTPF